LIGSVQPTTRGRVRKSSDWGSLYGDSNDVDLFRRWLRKIFSVEGKLDLPEGYAQSGISRFAGFMSFRFCRLYVENDVWIERNKNIDSFPMLRSIFESHSIVTGTVRMESLESDLVAILKQAGYEIEVDDLWEREKTNTSAHRPWPEYYDDELLDKVRQQDRFLVEQFGYDAGNIGSEH